METPTADDTIAAARKRAGVAPRPTLGRASIDTFVSEAALRHKEARELRASDLSVLTAHQKETLMKLPLDHWEDTSTPIVVCAPTLVEEIATSLGSCATVAQAVVTAKALVGMEAEETLKLLDNRVRVEKAHADSDVALVGLSLKEEESRSAAVQLDRAAKTQYISGLAEAQKKLAEGDEAYIKMVNDHLRGEQQHCCAKTALKLLQAQEATAAAQHSAAFDKVRSEMELAKLIQKEEAALAASIRDTRIKELRAWSEFEATVDEMKVERAKHAAQVERFDARIKRSEEMIQNARDDVSGTTEGGSREVTLD